MIEKWANQDNVQASARLQFLTGGKTGDRPARQALVWSVVSRISLSPHDTG